jgi:hypothetical protein
MKSKLLSRRAVDIALFVAMLVLMSHQVVQDAYHEWVGIAALVLLVTHLVQNRTWFAALPKGKLTGRRAATLILDAALVASFLVTMMTGMAMSSYAVPFLSGIVPVMVAQRLHLASSYWTMALAGLHIGMHWSAIAARFTKGRRPVAGGALLLLGIAVSAFGLAVFLRDGVPGYMVMLVPFPSFDYSKGPALVLAENASMICFFAFASDTVLRITRTRKERS